MRSLVAQPVSFSLLFLSLEGGGMSGDYALGLLSEDGVLVENNVILDRPQNGFVVIRIMMAPTSPGSVMASSHLV